MSTPPISAVITTFNQSRFLAEALNSAMVQQDCYPEIILVDDGSDDDTPRLAATFAERVRIIRTDHRGVAAARNIGWRSAGADLIAFLDGDDIWLSEKLAVEIRALRANPGAGLVYSDTMRVRADGTPIDRWGQHMRPVAGDALLPMLRQNRVHTSTVVMRRSVLEELDGFDESLPGWEDIDVWTRTAARYEFAYVPRVLARYRMHGAGISQLAMDLAHGRLTSAERVLREIPNGRLRPIDRDAVMANVYTQLAVAHYQFARMRSTREWLRRAWQTDPRSLLRGRSAETYLKSLAGPVIVGWLRSRIRPLKARYQYLRPVRLG